MDNEYSNATYVLNKKTQKGINLNNKNLPFCLSFDQIIDIIVRNQVISFKDNNVNDENKSRLRYIFNSYWDPTVAVVFSFDNTNNDLLNKNDVAMLTIQKAKLNIMTDYLINVDEYVLWINEVSHCVFNYVSDYNSVSQIMQLAEDFALMNHYDKLYLMVEKNCNSNKLVKYYSVGLYSEKASQLKGGFGFEVVAEDNYCWYMQKIL